MEAEGCQRRAASQQTPDGMGAIPASLVLHAQVPMSFTCGVASEQPSVVRPLPGPPHWEGTSS